MHDGVVLGEEGVLNQDLDAEKVWKDGEGCCYERREGISEMRICCPECLEYMC